MDDAIQKLRHLIESSDPLPISATHETLWTCLGMLLLSIDDMTDAVNAINTVYEELQERVNTGLGGVEKGAPRVLAILPHSHADPRLEHLAGEVGIAIVATDTTPNFMAPYGETQTDSYVKLSMHLQSSMASILSRRITLIIDGCKRLNVDGVLDHFHVGCRSVSADSFIIEEAIKKELGIPVLVLEWENFNPRIFNQEEFTRRLEVFKTMMKKERTEQGQFGASK